MWLIVFTVFGKFCNRLKVSKVSHNLLKGKRRTLAYYYRIRFTYLSIIWYLLHSVIPD